MFSSKIIILPHGKKCTKLASLLIGLEYTRCFYLTAVQSFYSDKLSWENIKSVKKSQKASSITFITVIIFIVFTVIKDNEGPTPV